jgi:hypothetical protein
MKRQSNHGKALFPFDNSDLKAAFCRQTIADKATSRAANEVSEKYGTDAC